MKNKQGKTEIATVIIILALFGFMYLFYDYTHQAPATTTTTPSTTTGVIPGCTQDTVTMYHGAYEVWGSPNSALTTTNMVSWWKKGASQDTADDMSSSDFVEPGVQIVEIAGSGITGSTTVYAGKAIEAISPCTTFSLLDFAKPYTITGYKHQGQLNQMIKNGTISIKAFDSDDGLLNNAVNNETVGANEEAKFNIKVQASSYEGLAPYGNMVWIIETNKSAWDQSTLTWSKGYTKTDVPMSYTPTIVGDQVQTIAYKIPGCPNLDAGELFCDVDLGTLSIKSKSQDVSTASRGSINITVMYEDFDTNTQVSGLAGIIFGVEDNVGTRAKNTYNTESLDIT